MVNELPNISDSWRGGVTDTAKVLGIARQTLRRYARIGKRNGGIDCTFGRNGRMVFIGRGSKRFFLKA